MSSRTTTEKQRRRLLAAREERAREENPGQEETWEEQEARIRAALINARENENQRRAEVAASVTEEDRIYEAGIRTLSSLADRERSLAQLRARFPNASAELVERAFEKGDEIREKGADVALLYRQDQITKQAALQAIEEAFPGFALDVYEAALGMGMFLTR